MAFSYALVDSLPLSRRAGNILTSLWFDVTTFNESRRRGGVGLLQMADLWYRVGSMCSYRNLFGGVLSAFYKSSKTRESLC